MDFDVLAAAAAAVPVPWPAPPAPAPARATAPADVAVPSIGAVQPMTPVALTPPPPPRRVELSFHEDLRVLITKVIDEQTGDTVVQTPARQVLDMVADVMAQIRTREES